MDNKRGSVPNMANLFGPTGAMLEVNVSSGWGLEFLEVAERFDKEWAKAIG